jgi:peroxiredoxin family protein
MIISGHRSLPLLVREEEDYVLTEQAVSPKKLALVIASGTLDKLYCALIMSTTAVSINWEAHLYFTFWGLMLLRKGEMDRASIDATFKGLEDTLKKRIAEMKYPTPYEMLRQAKATGRLFIYACTPTMGMFNIKKDDLIPEVDVLAGVPQFLDIAEHADVTLFI